MFKYFRMTNSLSHMVGKNSITVIVSRKLSKQVIRTKQVVFVLQFKFLD